MIRYNCQQQDSPATKQHSFADEHHLSIAIENNMTLVEVVIQTGKEAEDHCRNTGAGIKEEMLVVLLPESRDPFVCEVKR